MRLFLLILFLFPLGSTSVHAQTITLQQCKQWTKEHYPAMRQQPLLEQNRKHDQFNANLHYLPQLSLQAQASIQSEVLQIPLPPAIHTFGIELPSPEKDQYQISAQLTQLIWDGGKSAAGKKMIGAGEQIAQHELQVSMQTWELQVEQVFFSILLLDEQLKIQQLWETQLADNAKQVNVCKANGVANETDSDKMKVEQHKAHQQRLELEHARLGYLESLSVMTGQSLSKNVRFAMPPEIPLSETLGNQRPEQQLLQAKQDLITAQQKQNTAGNMPVASAFLHAGYGKPGLDFMSKTFHPFWIAGVNLSWNIGNLYPYRNKRQSLRLQHQMIELQKSTLSQHLQSQLTQALSEARKYHAILADDRSIITLREQIKASAAVRWQNGVITLTDLLQETAQWKSAIESESLHRVQYLMTLYKIQSLAQ